jgi:hypothetical protein
MVRIILVFEPNYSNMKCVAKKVLEGMNEAEGKEVSSKKYITRFLVMTRVSTQLNLTQPML